MAISWADFERVDMRVGVITDAQPFPDARKPAIKLAIDFGPLGVKRSSAQITERYAPADLVGRRAERIAQEPAEPRDASRLLVVDRGRRRWEDARFSDLPRWLRAGDCVMVNETRVIRARLLGALEGEDTAVELLMVRELEEGRWEALGRPGRRLRVGARVSL